MTKYIIYSSYDYACSKSTEQAVSRGCQQNSTTKLWWGVLKLTSGKGALMIPKVDWELKEDQEDQEQEDKLTSWQRKNLVDKQYLLDNKLIPTEEENENIIDV